VYPFNEAGYNRRRYIARCGFGCRRSSAVEQPPCKRKVRGSNPLAGSTSRLPCGLADCAVQLRQRVLIPPLPSPSPPLRRGERVGVREDSCPPPPSQGGRGRRSTSRDESRFNTDEFRFNDEGQECTIRYQRAVKGGLRKGQWGQQVMGVKCLLEACGKPRHTRLGGSVRAKGHALVCCGRQPQSLPLERRFAQALEQPHGG
jgi:hypothetical protein